MSEFVSLLLSPVLESISIGIDILLVGAVLVVLCELIVLLACLIAAQLDRSMRFRERTSGHA